MLGPNDVDGVEAVDSGWLAYLKARDGYERRPRPNRFLLVYPGSTVSLESELVSLMRMDPGGVADGPSDRCWWWRYRRIASQASNVDVASPAALQSRLIEAAGPTRFVRRAAAR